MINGLEQYNTEELKREIRKRDFIVLKLDDYYTLLDAYEDMQTKTDLSCVKDENQPELDLDPQ